MPTSDPSPPTPSDAGSKVGSTPIDRYAEFWPYYLREHSRPVTRGLHYIGTSLALACLVAFIASDLWILLVLALVSGYAFAWFGHFFVEHNRPATFKYPFWSLASDMRMYALAVTGRLGRELEQAGLVISDRRSA